MITILLGIVSSVFTEVVTALNKKLNGTVLQGYAAFLLVFVISFLGAILKTILTPGFSLSAVLNVQALTSTFAQIFAVSQVYFYLVMAKLNMDVQSSFTPKENAAIQKVAAMSAVDTITQAAPVVDSTKTIV